MDNLVRRFFLSVTFLTTLPLNLGSSKIQNKEQIQQDLSKSSIFFPLVGLFIGGILLGLYRLLQLTLLDSAVIDGIMLLVWIGLSGGLHLEGFADMVDGFSGGRNREDIIRIMKDSAVGAKGAIVLILVILLKFLLIHSLDHTIKAEAFLLAPVAGRWTMVLAGYLGRVASSENTLTQMFTLHLGKKELLIATLSAVVFSFFFLSYRCISLFLLTGLITGGMITYSNKKIKGICGDVIGAINEINELAALLLLSFSFMSG
jgi:adenosylcobinamide-GDP ribazoletransferase